MPEVVEKKTEQEEINNIHLRSEEVQDIISHIPNWIIMWGITVIFFVFMAFMTASWFIKYPDVIPARITVTTEPPPVKFVAKASGNIKLLVKENQQVTKNAIIGYIQTPAEIDDILFVEKKLEGFDYDNLGYATLGKQLEVLNKKLKLGILQSDYEIFLKACKDLSIFYEINAHNRQIEQTVAQIYEYQSLNQSLERQQQILQKELKIIQRRYNIDTTLFRTNVIASIEADASERQYLEMQRSVESSAATIINNNIQISSLKNRITDIDLAGNKEKRQLELNIENTYKNLQNRLRAFKKDYLFEAPFEGRVSYLKFWSDNQFANAGEEVLSVLPESKDIIGKIEMPVMGSGKVQIGQDVNIKLDNYPAEQYGMLQGKIRTISPLPTNNMYMINVTFTNGLETSYHKKLAFKQQMQGNTEIITEDLRLLERVFYQFKKLFDKVAK